LRDAHVHLEAALRLTLATAGPTLAERRPAALLETVVVDCARDLAIAGASEALLRYNPIAWRRRGVPLDEQREGVAAAVGRAQAEHRVALRIWVSLKREAAAADVGAAIEFALAGRDWGVQGVDISRSYDVAAADSRPGRAARPRALARAVARARDAGVEVAMHCGWYDGPAELVEALRLGASRIGHAVPLAQRPRLVAELSAREVTIEVCPTAFERRSGELLSWLPLEHWCDAGLRIEVGSDHPLALPTDIAREHRKMRAALPGWSRSAARGRRAA
jgi:adenosine deaminase